MALSVFVLSVIRIIYVLVDSAMYTHERDARLKRIDTLRRDLAESHDLRGGLSTDLDPGGLRGALGSSQRDIALPTDDTRKSHGA